MITGPFFFSLHRLFFLKREQSKSLFHKSDRTPEDEQHVSLLTVLFVQANSASCFDLWCLLIQSSRVSCCSAQPAYRKLVRLRKKEKSGASSLFCFYSSIFSPPMTSRASRRRLLCRSRCFLTETSACDSLL